MKTIFLNIYLIIQMTDYVPVWGDGALWETGNSGNIILIFSLQWKFKIWKFFIFVWYISILKCCKLYNKVILLALRYPLFMKQVKKDVYIHIPYTTLHILLQLTEYFFNSSNTVLVIHVSLKRDRVFHLTIKQF